MSGLDRDCEGPVDICEDFDGQTALVEDADVDTLAELRVRILELEREVARLDAVYAEYMRNLAVGNTHLDYERKVRRETEGLEDMRRELIALKLKLSIEEMKRG